MASARRGRPRPLHRWHRRAGVAAAGFLIFLLGTGVPLQFSAALGLGSRHVSTAAILDWYGLEAPIDVRVSGPAVSVGDQVYLNGTPVFTLEGFTGAVTLDGLIAVAGDRAVVLADAGGAELDRFSFEAGIHRIGRYHDTLAVAAGDDIHLADRDLVNFHPGSVAPMTVRWTQSTEADPATADRHRRLFRARMLTAERLLQDLHSGRVLGTFGVLLVDAASLLLAFLAISGLIMWWRTHRD